MKTFALIVLTITLTQTSMAQEKKIIFVCHHGAAKSVIAATYFNKLAKERNLNYVAEFRGTDPDSVVAPGAKEGLAKDNMVVSAAKPQKLLISDTANAERIILFTPVPADITNSIRTENWSAIQNIEGDYEARRNAIVKKINELLDTLEKQK
jgi:arsenate reductase (thioredoxin)